MKTEQAKINEPHRLSGGDWQVIITDATGHAIAAFWQETPGAATKEAKAYLSHAQLVEALKNLADEFDKYDAAMVKIGRGHEDYGGHRAFARAALAKCNA